MQGVDEESDKFTTVTLLQQMKTNLAMNKTELLFIKNKILNSDKETKNCCECDKFTTVTLLHEMKTNADETLKLSQSAYNFQWYSMIFTLTVSFFMVITGAKKNKNKNI